MKYRSDFVTNSSSSSYIVAIKNGTNIEAYVNGLEPSIRSFIIENKYSLESYEEYKKNAPITHYVVAIKKGIKNRLTGWVKMSIGEYNLYEIYSSNESESVTDLYLYCEGLINLNEDIKACNIGG